MAGNPIQHQSVAYEGEKELVAVVVVKGCDVRYLKYENGGQNLKSETRIAHQGGSTRINMPNE